MQLLAKFCAVSKRTGAVLLMLNLLVFVFSRSAVITIMWLGFMDSGMLHVPLSAVGVLR